MLYTSFETNIHSAEMDRAVYPWQQGCRVCHWGVTMIDSLFTKKTERIQNDRCIDLKNQSPTNPCVMNVKSLKYLSTVHVLSCTEVKSLH